MYILYEILGLYLCVDEVCHSSGMLRGVIWEFVTNCCRPTLRNIPEERIHQGRLTTVTEQMYQATLLYPLIRRAIKITVIFVEEYNVY